MSIFPFLQLQPLEPNDDGTVSDLDTYEEDDTIDLSQDITEEELESKFETLLHDDTTPISFSIDE